MLITLNEIALLSYAEKIKTITYIYNKGGIKGNTHSTDSANRPDVSDEGHGQANTHAQHNHQECTQS